MSYRRELRVAADHPCLAGHFPGNPVIPGVLLLDLLVETLAQWQPDTPVRGFRQVKFLQPLRPEQDFTLELETGKPGQLRFRCLLGEQLAATGTLDTAV
ncbi:hydroxymyristoyl-ACP dehydratase [Alkalilimnicola sp. S0819]|uniref:hydroxymyristoyl-ACP dehydratase n=1 Tax=Alkalilimnicola sp. S0819 TaxID=2613922 RepID=UPI001262450A|nr:hydroxymyristoyl-ACP dehydratase [Alkalilimnicola sp. S0819]KAB7624178.1 hydroxymyristoyl-ACP dehydratase [Alkalilimnicola sp. S0819]MPQ16432.1 hydroxymyristoyl-ACP dehydratase [Alkalilimnicola sp. S0819]